MRAKLNSTILQMSAQLSKAVKIIHGAGMCHGGERLETLAVFIFSMEYGYLV